MAKRFAFKRRLRKLNVPRRLRMPQRDPGVPRPGSTQLADKSVETEYEMPGGGGLAAGMR